MIEEEAGFECITILIPLSAVKLQKPTNMHSCRVCSLHTRPFSLYPYPKDAYCAGIHKHNPTPDLEST